MEPRLSVDRIEFTLYPSGSECSYIYQRLRNLEAFGRASLWRNTYTTSATVSVSVNPRINLFIQLGFTHGHNYAKIGWVLYGQTDDTKSRIEFLLNDIIPGGAVAVFNAKVAYIELAADFNGLSMSDVEAFDMRLQNGFVWPRIRRPKQTIYCGSRNGIRRVCIYDRRMRLRARGIYLAEPELRIEARLRFYGRDVTLANVASIRNPFSSLYLVDFDCVTNCLQGMRDARFLIDAERHGLNTALHCSADWNKKRRVEVIKKRALCQWWDSDLVWQGREGAIQEVSGL